MNRLFAALQYAQTEHMARILIINPNSSSACSDGIDAAVTPFRTQAGPRLDVVTTPDGPPAIYSWRDWHAAVEPVCRRIEADPADLYIVACASDPGIEAARARLIEAASACRAAGADSVILGCTGMAHHRAAIEEAAGIPVIEPCQAAVSQALGILLPVT